MKKILTISLIAASLPTFAGTFQTEVTAASYGSGTIDDGTNTTDFSKWAVGGSYYFSKVSTDKGVLAEAAFLDKKSSLSVRAGESSYDFDAPTDEKSYDNLMLSGRFVGSDGTIATIDYDNNENVAVDRRVDTVAAGIGTYIGDNQSIMLAYSTTLNKSNLPYGTKTYGAKYHGYMSLGGDAALSYDANLDYVEVKYDSGNNDEGFDIGAGVTYYPLRNLGFGLALAQTEVADVTTTSYGVDAKYFFKDNIAVSLSYTKEELDDDNAPDTVDTDLTAFGVTARF